MMAVRPPCLKASGCQQWVSSVGLWGWEVLTSESSVSTPQFRLGSTLKMGNISGVGKGMSLVKVLENWRKTDETADLPTKRKARDT